MVSYAGVEYLIDLVARNINVEKEENTAKWRLVSHANCGVS